MLPVVVLVALCFPGEVGALSEQGLQIRQSKLSAMNFLIVLTFVASALSSSDGCSRLCPCLPQLQNLSSRLDIRENIEESFVAEMTVSLENISSALDQLLRHSRAAVRIEESLDRLEARLDELAHGLIVSGEENCTDEEDPEDPRSKTCPAGWQPHGGSCYYFQVNQMRLTQDTAQDQCNQTHPGSSLVAIETADEFAFLRDYLTKMYPSIRGHTQNGFLTSGKKKGAEWVWTTTGAPVDLSVVSWGIGQPNGQDCIALWPSDSFKIADVYCKAFSREFICEI